jgi:ribulose-bisphosphate carboxylase large chain
MSFDRDLFRLPEAVAGQEYVLATYYLETPLELYEAANALAAEQSSGTWRRVGRETDDLREAHGAKVVGIYPVPAEILENNLPTAVEPDRAEGLRRPR